MTDNNKHDHTDQHWEVPIPKQYPDYHFKGVPVPENLKPGLYQYYTWRYTQTKSTYKRWVQHKKETDPQYFCRHRQQNKKNKEATDRHSDA